MRWRYYDGSKDKVVVDDQGSEGHQVTAANARTRLASRLALLQLSQLGALFSYARRPNSLQFCAAPKPPLLRVSVRLGGLSTPLRAICAAPHARRPAKPKTAVRRFRAKLKKIAPPRVTTVLPSHRSVVWSGLCPIPGYETIGVAVLRIGCRQVHTRCIRMKSRRECLNVDSSSNRPTVWRDLAPILEWMIANFNLVTPSTSLLNSELGHNRP